MLWAGSAIGCVWLLSVVNCEEPDSLGRFTH